MNTLSRSFREHCITGARKFVQTALVIDNEPILDTPDATESSPLRAVRRPGSILSSTPSAPAIIEVGSGTFDRIADQENQPATGPEPPIQPTAPSELNGVLSSSDADPNRRASKSIAASPESHKLKAKELMDAFLKTEVICGLYKPTAGENMVELSSAAAQHADLVILDWYLEEHNSGKAKEIIHKILRDDLEQNGRLRLIAVYTAEQGLPDLAEEVLRELNNDEGLRDRLKLGSGGYALVGPDTRVCFINKLTDIGGNVANTVAESDLPGRLIDEFALITEGVLATFAVNAVAAIRRAAHHLISVFSKDLDGAYVGHRCSLPNPEDAKEFATELISSELRNVVSMDEVAERCMDVAILESWIDHITEGKHVFTDHNGAKASAENVKQFLRGGESAVKAAGIQGIKPETVGKIFYKSAADAWKRCLQFARLTTFKREAMGRTRFPEKWRPVLTLGSVLKVIREGGESDRYSDLSGDYLVCMQPRCDSVRLDPETSFPFQIATVSPKPFNLVVKDGNDDGTTLRLSAKPRDSIMLRFARSSELTKTVEAVRDAQYKFVFIDVRRRRFQWLGEVNDLKAQRDASELASRVHSVGIDEFEWLRRATDGKISLP